MFKRRSNLLALMGLTPVLALIGVAIVPTEASAAGVHPYYSTFLAGYDVINNTPAPSPLSAQFTVPTISGCGAKGANRDNQFVGVMVEDNSTTYIFSGLYFGCQKGEPFDQGVFINYDAATTSSVSVSAGETVAVSATMNEQSSSLSFGVVGGSTQTLAVAEDTAVSAFVGADSTGGVPDFGKIKFSDVDLNGIGLSPATTGIDRAIRTTNGKAPPSGMVQIQTGRLTSASFSLRFEHS